MYIKPKKKKNNSSKYLNKKENFLHLFFGKIGKFLTHRIYFMFIPHSKKKTKTLSLPVYSIIIIVLIISLYRILKRKLKHYHFQYIPS